MGGSVEGEEHITCNVPDNVYVSSYEINTAQLKKKLFILIITMAFKYERKESIHINLSEREAFT